MKKTIAKMVVMATIMISISACGVLTTEPAAKEPAAAKYTDPLMEGSKVIFDTDMMYLNDDAVALYMLSQADKAGKLDLLGVTTVGGNVFASEATTATLRQLEMIGREDIPVYQGTDVPLAGFRDMVKEEEEYGVTEWCGAYRDKVTGEYADMKNRPTDYMNLGYEPKFGYPKIAAQDMSAWDFMVQQVHRYPGEVTIMAVGAATNVAIAIMNDPSFVEDAAGIIYMGGDIDVAGNASAAAEFNWYYDPDAIKLCLGADWKSQVVVPDDLARQVSMQKEIYDRIRKAGESDIIDMMLKKETEFDPDYVNYVWDVLVPAIYMNPVIMSDLQTRYLTVDDQPGLDYGRAVSFVKNSYNDPETGKGMPKGVKPVKILMGIDEEAFWDYYVDILTAN